MSTGSAGDRGRPRVLVTSQFYEPSTGGGLGADARATVAALAPHADVVVVAGDREVGEAEPMDVPRDRWVPHPGYDRSSGGAGDVPPRVRYLTLGVLPLRKVRAAVRDAAPDVIALFSLWSPTSMAVVVLRRLGLLGRRPPRLVIAPCGELFQGGLARKAPKKRAVLWLGRRLALWRDVVWRATDEAELRAIADTFPGGDVRIAPVLPGPSYAIERIVGPAATRRIQLVTVGLVVPNKGLAFAIERLGELASKGIPVHLDAFGAQVDPAYLATCHEAIERLPANATVDLHGVAPHERIAEALARADAFVLPTHTENFCYAILEALDAGCPVLISDQTPWGGLEADRAGWDLALADPQRWVDALLEVTGWDPAEREAWAAGARARAAAVRAEIGARGTAAWLDLLGLSR